jgi:protein BUR2
MPQASAHPSNSLTRSFKSPSAVLAEAEQQWIFTEDELLRTPSIVDGMTADEERERRNKGVNFITQVGIMLKLPQTTLTAAAIFFQRFLMRKSFVSGKAGKGMHHYVSWLINSGDTWNTLQY